jgi:hypothetical protein
MTDTSHRVARVTEELRALLTQLQWSAFQDSSPGEQKQVLNALLNGGLVEDLRKAIDQLSEFLWNYIESAAAKSGSDPDVALENIRLLRMTELLRLLHRSTCPSNDPLAFVQRVTASVDQYLETSNHRESPWEQSA